MPKGAERTQQQTIPEWLRRLLFRIARGWQAHHILWRDARLEQAQWHHQKATAWSATKDRYSDGREAG